MVEGFLKAIDAEEREGLKLNVIAFRISQIQKESDFKKALKEIDK